MSSSPSPYAHASTAGSTSAGLLRRGMIALGGFCFRFRNAMFPIVIGLTLLASRPQRLDGGLDEIMFGLGLLSAFAGAMIRLSTIGFRYIERGGRNKRVYASRLVRRGMYGLTRNPMYIGNILIASGASLMIGSPATCLIIIPFFVIVYHAIVLAEEEFLRGRFGRGYEQYCESVNRFVPSLDPATVRRAFIGMRFNWKRAVRQDLSTLAGLLAGAVVIPFWRIAFLDGWDAAWPLAPIFAVLLIAVLTLYAVLHRLKKLGWLRDAP